MNTDYVHIIKISQEIPKHSLFQYRTYPDNLEHCLNSFKAWVAFHQSPPRPTSQAATTTTARIARIAPCTFTCPLHHIQTSDSNSMQLQRLQGLRTMRALQ